MPRSLVEGRTYSRDVDAGHGTLLLGGKLLLLSISFMESSIRVQKQSEIGRGVANDQTAPWTMYLHACMCTIY